MTSTDLYLLGSPRIESAGATIEFDTRKATAVLAYLAVSAGSGAYQRDSLAALFWPDAEPARAHAALRRTLSALHRSQAAACLKIDREAVTFERGGAVWLDVDVFLTRIGECRTHGHAAGEVCPACLPILAEAASLYRDDFMAGFSLRDSPGFDDWQFFQAESLRRELAGALERLAVGLCAQGEFDPAIAHARRWLALDPLHEPAQRQLMLLYAWAGQRAAALRQYRECVRVLDRELGVAPLRETTELYQAIQENRPPAPPAPLVMPAAAPARPAPSPPAATTVVSAITAPSAPAPAGSPAPHRPLVGRNAEWTALLANYLSAAPDGRLVVVEGEPGIGKTRLAETFLQHARQQGARVSITRCYEGELNLAYGPFVEALRAAVVQAGPAPDWLPRLAPHWLAEIIRLLPELPGRYPDLPPPAPLDSAGAQGRFFESLRQVLIAALSGAAPGLLLIDDAHWIDEASLDVLTYLVRRLRGQPFLLMVTWRTEAVPAGHRLRQLLAEAERSGRAAHLSLNRLSLPAVAELVTEAWAADAGTNPGRPPLEPAAIERLYRESEGLPFFVVEYLANLFQAGDAPQAWPLPGGVRGLLQARLASVDDAGWQLLSAAAVIGRSFDFDTLRASSGRGEDETVAGLEALLAAGLVNEVVVSASVPKSDRASATVAPGGLPSYDFCHEKLRALVYEETSLARRRLLHRRSADALAAQARRRSGGQTGPESPLGAQAGLIAQHYQQGGREAEAAEFYRLAGEHARRLYANAEALAHFHAALALGHPAAAALHESMGDLQGLLGNYDAALMSYEVAAALSAPASLAGLEHKLGALYNRRGDWDFAESQFQAALKDLGDGDNAEARSRLYADWSLTAHHQSHPDQALQFARRALELAEAAGDLRALAQSHNILGILSSSHDDLVQARHHLERSLELAEQLGDPGARAAALNNLALAYGREGQFEPALNLAGQALSLCALQGDRHREAALHNNLADLLNASGQAEAARQHVKQSVTIYAEIGAEGVLLQPEIWKLAEW